ncbi:MULTISPECIES: flagellar hook-associated protein FlgL [Chromobacterium]|uniref:Flagellar hook-associated protein FlgL n=2 Tax=Chromobacterium TaxID=535 RepID=A0ABS3GPU1_9NEIS|nr:MULTISPECIES: flagellar hook-associated protein FlgL [Chromobacterium]AXT47023.1 flagellar hook-associated protein 3 [Chromobacterium rhizoryzae]MBK0415657.1 flagellar hook-associated protein FlgL [Chromobacterium haemolyticum]MBO0417071.1 flagellar hook-associated protein FlgL [Chromobacterium haemolyticum]MBO0500218.1 flagellar hook-associated protein FlgL [Chromobacterium haemolyticum]MDH0342760.1 flagellar hook-associated protein FlgL [Chromobacterium haemolyticum]
MRISSNNIYQSGLNNMQSLQASIYKLTMQIDNQQRVVTPADDPVAAARILLISQSQGQNSQYISNTQAVSSWLSLSETAIKSSSDLMASMKSLAISAGSGALSPTELQAIQKQLQEGITELTTYANSTDGRGNYLFSGNKTDTLPFAVSLSAVPPASYLGDTGQRSVQISASQQMTISDPGSTVFGTPGGSATAAFDGLIQLNTLLGQNPKPANFGAQLNSAINAIDSAQQQMSLALASIGARGQQNDNMQNVGGSLKLQYASSIGDLQDLDMPQAISDFTLAQTSLKYSQLTYNKVTQLSLFNYIS